MNRYAPYIGKQHISNNGRRLLEVCMDNEMVITNTRFGHRDLHTNIQECSTVERKINHRPCSSFKKFNEESEKEL